MNDKIQYTTTCKIQDLQLGMKIKLFEGPFGWGTVVEINAQRVLVLRPYVMHHDFTMGARNAGQKIVAGLGFEEVDLWIEDSRDVQISTEAAPKFR